MTIRGFGKTNLTLSGAAAAVILMGGSLSFAQPTLPLPAPGANPAGPTIVPSDTAAKARAQALAAKANVDIAEAWTRATSAPNAAVYLHIVSAKDPDRLIAIDSAMAKSVELHEDAAQAQARFGLAPVIDIPGGGTVNLGPGGRYLMLVGLKEPLKEGDSFLITLHFDKAGMESTAVKVLGPAANAYPPAAGRRGDTTASVSER
jgi:periplasmic copper chaperone A